MRGPVFSRRPIAPPPRPPPPLDRHRCHPAGRRPDPDGGRLVHRPPTGRLPRGAPRVGRPRRDGLRRALPVQRRLATEHGPDATLLMRRTSMPIPDCYQNPRLGPLQAVVPCLAPPAQRLKKPPLPAPAPGPRQSCRAAGQRPGSALQMAAARTAVRGDPAAFTREAPWAVGVAVEPLEWHSPPLVRTPCRTRCVDRARGSAPDSRARSMVIRWPSEAFQTPGIGANSGTNCRIAAVDLLPIRQQHRHGEGREVAVNGGAGSR
jgi:hypothetical protein